MPKPAPYDSWPRCNLHFRVGEYELVCDGKYRGKPVSRGRDHCRRAATEGRCGDVPGEESAARTVMRSSKSELERGARERLDMRNQFAEAHSKSGELRLFYQPQVDLEGHVLKAWKPSCGGSIRSLGWLPPADFISMAEETGLIVPNRIMGDSRSVPAMVLQWRKRGIQESEGRRERIRAPVLFL